MNKIFFHIGVFLSFFFATHSIQAQTGHAQSTRTLSATADQNAATSASLPVDDDKFGCIDKATAQRYISEMNIDVASFGGLELCDLKVDTKRLFNDLQLIEQGRLGSNGQNLFIKGFVTDANYYNWFRKQTLGMERGNDVPFATAYNSYGHFTLQNGWAKASSLSRVGTLIHEARHTAGYRHTPCVTGPYAGKPVDGCDKDYSYGGSHAIEMEYYARVTVQGENFHPIYKTMARLMAVARSNFVFNKSPIQQRQALMALDDHNQAHVFIDNKLVQRETPQIQGALKRTSFGAVLFDGLKAFAIELSENSGVPQNITDDFSYYKLLSDQRGQGNDPLLDLEEYDANNKRYVLYLSPTGKLASFSFLEGVFKAPVNAPNGSVHFATLSPDGNKGLFVVTKNGEVYSLDPENPARQTLLNLRWPADVKNFVSFENQFLTLKTNGELLSSRADFQVFKNMKIEQILNVPAYDAFAVIP